MSDISTNHDTSNEPLLPWHRVKQARQTMSLSESDIFGKCDEEEIYTLYMRLLDEDEETIDSLFQKDLISSPLRDGDYDPSFGLFINKDTGQLWFKDFGRTHLRGNAIEFAYRAELEIMERLKAQTVVPTEKMKLDYDIRNFTKAKAMHKLDERLGLHLNGSVIKGIPRQSIEYKKANIQPKKAVHIEVKSVPYNEWPKFALDYWAQWGIALKVLKKYDVQLVHQLFFDHKFIADFSNDSKDELAFTYPLVSEETGEVSYKIYQPYSKNYKWRNNYEPHLLEGWHQLWFNETEDSGDRDRLLIITKATKEVMYYRQHFNVDAIAEKSESQVIDEKVINLLRTKYSRIIAILDNDSQGKSTARKYEKLGIETTFYSSKNITDLHESKGQKVAYESFEFLTRNNYRNLDYSNLI